MRRFLLVTSRFPLPVRRGNQVRTLQWMDALDDMQGVVVSPRPESPSLETDLREMGVELVTYSPSVLGRLAGLARATMSGRPLQEGIYDFGSARRAVAAALDRGDYDLVIVQMIRCGWAAEMVRTREDSPPILFDAIDAMSLHFRRGAQSRAWPLSSVARIEAARCARREGEMAGLADLTLAVASRDIDAMTTGGCNTLVLPVAGREIESRPSSDGPPTILLSGNLGYRPTVEGAVWFATEVWPRLRAAVPTIRWLLVGARPARSIAALARREGIEVHSDVADMGPFFSRSTVAIAPLRSGSGVPMKVLEAWAARLPVVATPWAAAGVEAEVEAALAVADSANEWVSTVTEILENESMASALASAGFQVWRDSYSPQQIRRRMRAAAALAAKE